MRPFRSLSARLTVQFALLFAAAMLAVSAALSSFIAGSASRQVESQLQSSGAVYDRLWQQRSRELQNAAQLLARDFGFRAAVASGDLATIQSALSNAAGRLRVRSAFIVSAEGRVSSIGPAIPGVKTATLFGWVVFASDLDSREMRSLERLSAIPLQAAVIVDDHDGWAEASGSLSA